MQRMTFGLSGLLTLIFVANLSAATYNVEQVKAAPPEEVSPEIREKLADSAYKITRGTSRTLAHIWLARQWELPKFEPAGDVIYPFLSGQLVGVIKYERDANDFRYQEIEEGVYTLRYAQQPVDGAHIGTSPTRDFLLLLKAEKDKSLEALDYRTLTADSAEAVDTTHPGLLSLQRLEGDGPIRENDQFEWWIVRLTGEGSVKGETKKVPLDLVIVGQAIE